MSTPQPQNQNIGNLMSNFLNPSAFSAAVNQTLGTSQNPQAPAGQTNPSKVAASTAVKSPSAPATPPPSPLTPQQQATNNAMTTSGNYTFANGSTSAQANAIINGANGSSLTNQLYNGKNGTVMPPSHPQTPASPAPSAPVNPSAPNNALLQDPELSALNTDINTISGQEAQVENQASQFQTDQYGQAIASPTVGDYFGNNTSFNAQKSAQIEGNLGNALTADQAAFANREGQVKDSYTPYSVSPGDTVINPYNGETIAGGLGGYEGYQNAQQVNGLISQYPDAKNSQGQAFTYDQSKSPQQNLQDYQQNYLVNSPTYQKSTYGEAGANSNYKAGQIAGNQGAITSNTQTAGELSGVRDSVTNMSNALISQLATSGGFNPSNSTAVNEGIQAIAKQTGNPQYQILENQMTDIAATYAQILNPGSSTDASKSLAQGLINQLANGSSIQQVIAGLDAQAQKKISGYQTASSDIQSGTNPNPSSAQVGQTVTAPDGSQIVITD